MATAANKLFSVFGGASGSSPITSLAFVGDSTVSQAGNMWITPTGTGTLNKIQAAFPSLIQASIGKDLPIVYDTSTSPDTVTFAAAGVKSDHVIATQIPNILMESVLPSHVIWRIGTNDVSQSYSIATSESNIRAGIATLKTNGIASIITTINPRRSDSGKVAEVAAFNDMLETIAASTGMQFIDQRSILENGITHGEEKLGSLYDGVHQWAGANYELARNIGAAISSRLSGNVPDMFAVGNLIHDEDDISISTTPSNYSTATSTVARTDGVVGNWTRLSTTGSPTISIGAGNAGVLYTPKGGETTSTVFVVHRVSAANQGYTGDDPTILVSEDDAGRKWIEVRANTTGFTSTTTAAEAVAAINQDAAASALVTASPVGDGTGVIKQGSGWDSWSLLLDNAATNPPDGSWVRGVIEINNSAYIRHLFARLWRTTPFSPTLRDIEASIEMGTKLIGPNRWVITTPWYQTQSGDSGWRIQLQFSSDIGNVDIGRFGVQVYGG